MSTYRVEWPCCGSVTETQAWEPEHCPFCTPDEPAIQAPDSAPAYLAQPGGQWAAYPASLVASWPEHNRKNYTVKLYPQAAAIPASEGAQELTDKRISEIAEREGAAHSVCNGYWPVRFGRALLAEVQAAHDNAIYERGRQDGIRQAQEIAAAQSPAEAHESACNYPECGCRRDLGEDWMACKPETKAQPKHTAAEAFEVCAEEVEQGEPWISREAASAIIRKHARAAQAPAVAHGWQPIETAPKDGTAILAFWKPVSGSPASHCYGITEFVEGRWRNPEEDDDYYIAPTHWMPLPAAPQTKEPINDR